MFTFEGMLYYSAAMSRDVKATVHKFHARLRVCVLIVAALLFGQFTAVAHAHDDHDDVPVACDICLTTFSDEDDLPDEADDEPNRLDPPVYIASSTLSLPQDVSAPEFERGRPIRPAFVEVGRQPNAPRAPPV